MKLGSALVIVFLLYGCISKNVDHPISLRDVHTIKFASASMHIPGVFVKSSADELMQMWEDAGDVEISKANVSMFDLNNYREDPLTVYRDTTDFFNIIFVGNGSYFNRYAMADLFLGIDAAIGEHTEPLGVKHEGIENRAYRLPNGNEVLKMKFKMINGDATWFYTEYQVQTKSEKIVIAVTNYTEDLEGIARSVVFNSDYEFVAPEDYSLERAQMSAPTFLRDPFFWNQQDSTAPFGNYAGKSAFQRYLRWRNDNPDASPTLFIDTLLNSMQDARFDLSFIEWKDLKNVATKQVPLHADEAIIAVGFGQYILDGKIDEKLLTITRNAIYRESLPELVNKSIHRQSREANLNKLLLALERM